MRRTAAALVVMIAVLAPSSAWAKWTRFSTEHFVFVSDAPDGSVREIAQRLELFRTVVGQIFSEQLVTAPVPTVVVVFQGDRSFSTVRPQFNGKPVEAAGYFLDGEDAHYIAMNAGQGRAASPVVYHEYVHSIVRNALGVVPVWLNEGLAQFYQTFESTSGGRAAIIGIPDQSLHALLNASNSLLPLAELIAVDGDSPIYNEGNRRLVFYAQSWGLVHYLTIGNPARSAQLKSYLAALAAGEADPDAFHRAFGADDATLERELRGYIHAVKMNAVRIELPARATAPSLSPVEVISDDEAAGYLGELLARQDRAVDARTFLKKTIDTNGAAARAIAALGLLELRSDNQDGALPLLERAANLSPGVASIQAAYGRALTLRANRGLADEDETRARARTVLTRALELEPDNVSTAVTLAEVEMAGGSNPERAVALMQRAVGRSPGREEYRLMLAEALAMAGDYRAASNYLGPLMARGRRSETRDRARQVLARVAAAQNAALARNSSAGAATAAPGGRAPETAAPTVSTGDAARPSLPQGAFQPTLRPLRAGESRVVGLFSAVECRPGAVILQIDAPGGPVRLAARSFTEIEFLTYRQDSPASVACGAQRPAFRVLATFRSADAAAGASSQNQVVAIELLPDGYEVK
jgi:tetratricopeptide (TPR) repeat protein